MPDFTEIGLNSNMRAKTSPLERVQLIPPVKFDSDFEVQTKRLKTSQIATENMIKNSVTGTSGVNGLAANDIVTFTFTLSPNVNFTTAQNMAQVYHGVYQGSTGADAIAANQISPHPGGTTLGTAYQVRDGYKHDTAHGTNTVYAVSVINISGGAQNIYFEGDAVYIQERDGQSS